jgi:hypothetical protein
VTDGVRLAVWSGPRNISTALMRSFENRPDCTVVDEPLYAFYLQETGLEHPGRPEIIEAGETSWEKLVVQLTSPTEGVSYQKHMAQHLVPPMPRAWIGSLTNVLLIRDPTEVVASYTQVRDDVSDADIGIHQQVEIYEQLEGNVPVIDSADFLQNPEAYLRWMCGHIGVAFTERMLTWPDGPRDSDGVWAPYWYGSVWRSTGFEPYAKRDVQLIGEGAAAAERCRADYERLHATRVVI